MERVIFRVTKFINKTLSMNPDSSTDFSLVLQSTLSSTEWEWLMQALAQIKEQATAKRLYLNYSLVGGTIENVAIINFDSLSTEVATYFEQKSITTVELSRVYLLQQVLLANDTFIEATKKLIQVADKNELETFLKYLVFLPEPVNYQFAAVEALRSNIGTVFEAIAAFNPYPALYFNEQQWNQMYLKAVFIGMDLKSINHVDKRANKTLATIISDYAHERWAASRTIDPVFWQPISNYLQGELVADVKRLFSSEDDREVKAATLVCYYSDLNIAAPLLQERP